MAGKEGTELISPIRLDYRPVVQNPLRADGAEVLTTTLEKNEADVPNLPPMSEGAAMVTLEIARLDPEDGKGQHRGSFQVRRCPCTACSTCCST